MLKYDKKITCFVVDDDEIDRLTILSFLEQCPFLEITGKFNSPVQALAAALIKPPDVLFLDIDMPEMNGLALRKQLLHIPVCIFITSYPDYAVEGFEMAALDFLVKPFSPERITRAIQRLKEYFILLQKAELLNHTIGADTIFIKEGTTQIRLQVPEIIYLEALNNYTSIITANRKHAVLFSFSNLLKEKAFINFIRIHRSYAVQKHYLKKYNSYEVVLTNNITLPVGRSFKEILKGL